MTESYELAFVIGGLFLSLSAFSLIFGDNYLFRLGAAILSGAVSAYICVLIAESYFYPLILDIINNRANLSTPQIIRLILVTIGIILLFMKLSREFDFEGSMIEGIENFFCYFGGKQVINYHVSRQNVFFGII